MMDNLSIIFPINPGNPQTHTTEEAKMEPRIAGDYATQPSVSAAESNHPRFEEYKRYRAALARQLVSAYPFATWLRETEQEESGRSTVYEVTSTKAKLSPGWYKNVFPAKSNGCCYTHGPFATEQEAEAA